MIKWTTPTLTCSIPEGVDCDYVILTIRQGSVAIEKTVMAADITNGQFSVTFTQSETGQLDAGSIGSCVEAQLNIIKDDTRAATNIVQMEICKNLHDQSI